MKYVGSIIAFKDYGDYTMATFLVEADSEEEALVTTIGICRERYKNTKGYRSHNATCTALETLGENLLVKEQ